MNTLSASDPLAICGIREMSCEDGCGDGASGRDGWRGRCYQHIRNNSGVMPVLTSDGFQSI